MRTFAPVKSDPYAKGLRRRQHRFELWPDTFWKELCRDAWHYTPDEGDYPLSPRCAAMIREQNRIMYGID